VSFGYGVSDFDVFFLPTYVSMAFLIAAGLAFAEQALRASRLRPLWWLPGAVGAVTLALAFPSSYEVLRPLPAPFPEEGARSLVRSLPEDALVFLVGDWFSADRLEFPLLYVKSVDGECPRLLFRCLHVFMSRQGTEDFLAEVGASPDLRERVLAAPAAYRPRTFLQLYTGRREVYTDNPYAQHLQTGGHGWAYQGWLWRRVPGPGVQAGADPGRWVAWVRREAGKPGADLIDQDFLSVPLLNLLRLCAQGEPVAERRRVAQLVIELCPNSREANYQAALAALEAGDAPLAGRVLRRLECRYPRHPRTYMLRGYLLMAQGRYREALAEFDEASAVDGGYAGEVAAPQAACRGALVGPQR